MNTTIRDWITGMAGAALLAFAPLASAATTLRIAGNFPATHSSSIAMRLFKKEVEKSTGGSLRIDLFPAMQLGGAQQNVDQVRSGTIFATWLSTAYLSRTVPELQVLSVPFLFSDRIRAFKVIDGQTGSLLDEKLAAKGFVSLGYMELGQRNLTNRVRPVKALADLKGLKIRLQPDETQIAIFRALGTNPVSMDIKEIYSALQQGVIDGQENPYSVILDRHFYQVQKYLADTGHVFDFIVIVANKHKFDSLTDAQRAAVREAMTKAVAFQREKATREDTAALARLRQQGMEFDPVSPQFRDAMRKATVPVVESLRKRIGAELVDAVIAQAKN